MRDDHIEVLLEDLQHKLTRFAEAMDSVPGKVQSVDERLARVEQTVTTIKAVVTDQSRNLQEHAGRLQTLEEAA